MGGLALADGRAASVVLVGPRSNPKGAVLVLAGSEEGKVNTIGLLDGTELLHPQHILDILCTQERAFGSSQLTPPKE